MLHKYAYVRTLTRYFKKFKLSKLSLAFLIALIFISPFFSGLYLSNNLAVAQAMSSKDFGVVGFISSRPASGDKQTAVTEAKNAGFGWEKEEYTYSDNMDFAPYDSAYSKIHGSGLKVLGLLTYPGDGKSHDAWKNYVNSVVGHFPGVSAWEIMNEADNYLSAADYAVYLKEANAIIKSKGSATVVCTGLGARKEVYPFWEGLKSAGAWDSFDVIGLHMYHDGTPYEDSYNNGTMPQEVQKVVNISDGKGIWVTEFGYDPSKYGESDATKWLIEGLGIVRGFSEVQHIFIFRLYDNGDSFGLLTSGLKEKPVYTAVKNFLTGSAPAPAPAPVSTPAPVASSAPVNNPAPAQPADSNPAPTAVPVPKIPVDKAKSYIRLDGTDIVSDGKAQYRIVVGVEDASGKMLTDRKPGIILGGGQTELTDFVLVGDEWFGYVSSTDPGKRTAQITVGSQDLGTLKMNFVAEKVETPVLATPSASVTPAISPVASIPKSSKSNNMPIYYVVGGLVVLGGAAVVLKFKLKK